MIIVGLKQFLTTESITADRQMLTVIFDLVKRVMGSMEMFEEQIQLLDLVNKYIIKVKRLDDEHLNTIIKINTILHGAQKEKYETMADSEFVNFLIQLIASNSKSKELIKEMASFVEGLNKIKTKPFEIKDQTAEMMISSNTFKVDTRLNIVRNFLKLPTNIPIFLRNKLLQFIMDHLVAVEEPTRRRALDVVKTLLEIMPRKPDVRASLRENSMRYPDSKIFGFLVDTLEKRRSYGVEFEEALLAFLKEITAERTFKDYQEVFADKQNVEEYIRDLGTKSENPKIRQLFTFIYAYITKNNWAEEEQKEDLANTQLVDPNNPSLTQPIGKQITIYGTNSSAQNIANTNNNNPSK